MVTKLGVEGRIQTRSLILAKIYMVTKHMPKITILQFCLILAKIYMVTKLLIQII